jgi:hypothetical protein
MLFFVYSNLKTWLQLEQTNRIFQLYLLLLQFQWLLMFFFTTTNYLFLSWQYWQLYPFCFIYICLFILFSYRFVSVMWFVLNTLLINSVIFSAWVRYLFDHWGLLKNAYKDNFTFLKYIVGSCIENPFFLNGWVRTF